MYDRFKALKLSSTFQCSTSQTDFYVGFSICTGVPQGDISVGVVKMLAVKEIETEM